MSQRLAITLLYLALPIAVGYFGGCSVKKDSAMSLDGEWLFKIDSLDNGITEKWFQEGHDRTGWTKVHVPDYWDRYNLEAYDGVGWFATTLDVADTSQKLALFFGGVDDDADLWLNGNKVGTHVGYSEPFYFEVGTGLRPGKNELIVRVNDHGGPGGIYKPVTLLPLRRVHELLRSKLADLEARPSADWVRDAVIYEVYLRSFSKEGSFKALERRLSELKDLGVTIVWLMPIHAVGELNRKGTLGSPYAVQDFYGINPEFGTLDDFKSLVKAAHALGMKIIIDLVAYHTAWDSKLIMEHPDWFTTNAEGAIVAPNADWTDVADLNYDHHELRKYIIEMMKYWVRDIGIDGFRCDVAELVPTDFWARARKELDKIKPVIMLSEGTLPEHHVEAFDLTYSWSVYDVLGKIIKGTTPVSVFDEILQTELYRFPKGSLRLRFNTNHDKNAYDAPAVVKYSLPGAKATALLAFTFPGVPLIYNGEEVGNNKKLDLFEKVEIDWTKNPDFREFYRKLGMLHAKHAALRRGEYLRLQNTDSTKVYSFARRFENDYVVVVINFDQRAKSVEVSLPSTFGGELKEYFTGATVQSANGRISLKLKALDSMVLLPSEKAGTR
ncbi:MAG: alpha-amylase family glycosyl hydrolase [Bacteroidota bacterium]